MTGWSFKADPAGRSYNSISTGENGLPQMIGMIGREERQDPAHSLRLSQVLGRLLECFFCGFACDSAAWGDVPQFHGGGDTTGADRVYANAKGGQLTLQYDRHTVDTPLAGSVGHR